MSARRIDMHRLQELVRLHRMGTTTREIARLLKMSRRTEQAYRNALTAAGLLGGDAADLPDLETLKAAVIAQYPPKTPSQELSSIEPWAKLIGEMLERGAGPRAIYDRLRLERDDFNGSYWAVKRLCKRLTRERGVQPQDVAIPVETAPGDVAQVDFGYLGHLIDPESGETRKAWVFVMVLGFSRHMFAQIVFDQRTETWLTLHAEAFAHFGGVPRVVVPDNLKAAVIRAAFSIDEPTALNRSYRELARHYGFLVDPTPVYDPEKKGKVESGVKYVRRNFWRPRNLRDVREAKDELARWTQEVAGKRQHGATGRQPLAQFETIERAHLNPLPTKPFIPVSWKQGIVHRDSHVVFERRLYSVPWQLVGQTVWIKADSATVAIYHQDERVATHARNGTGHRSTVESHLPEGRSPMRHRNRAYWEERADRMGPAVGKYIREVFDSDDVLYQLRTVIAIVRHLETFPVERARAACLRASFYGNYAYGGIKNILKRALDLQPLPEPLSPPTPANRTPRFSRYPVPLFAQHQEESTCHPSTS